MKHKVAFSYLVLRYVHDLVTEEFANIGVVLFCPEHKYLSCMLAETHSRLSTFFDGFNVEDHTRILSEIKRLIADIDIATIDTNVLQFPIVTDILLDARAFSGLLNGATSYMCTSQHASITDNPSEMLLQLFNRYVKDSNVVENERS